MFSVMISEKACSSRSKHAVNSMEEAARIPIAVNLIAFMMDFVD
jgi:hypothetical protein